MSILKCNGKIFVLSGSPLTWNAISIPTVTSNLTYTGDIQSPTITGYDENTMTMQGKTNGTNAGTYEITFTPKSGYQWDDGTRETKTFTWSIAKAPRNARVVTSSPIVINTNSTEVVVKIDGIYTTPVDLVISNSQVATATLMNFMQGLANVKVIKVGPGTCTVTVNAAETTNYLATSCSFDVACYATVEVPSQSGALTFMDSAYQTPTWNNYNSAYLTIGGTTEARSAGTYTATFTPIAPYATWTDGSSDTKNVNWTIERATISTPYLVNTNVFTYTGDAIIPQFIGYNSQKMSRGGTTAAVNVGHYEATFTPYENYQWPGGDTGTIGVGWHIVKAAGSLSLSTNSLTIDTNSTYGYITVTRAGDGAISASSNNTGVATVSVSGNTVTVTKMGQGSATITISVAEGTNYNAPSSKTCSVTCKTNTPVSSLAVGSSVYMNVGGVRTEFLIVNHGNPNASLYDASCDGTWLLMKNVYECRPFNDSGSSRNNIYPRSPIHTYLNGNFLAKFDTGIQGTLKQVKIPYTQCAYGGTSEIMSLSNGVSAKIFLLGAKELGFTRDDMPKDGSKLSYFEAGFTDSANGKRIAYLNGESRNYFTRTPRPNTEGDGSTLWQVFDGGSCSLISTDSTVLGIRPALVLPSNVTVDANMNVIASGT